MIEISSRMQDDSISSQQEFFNVRQLIDSGPLMNAISYAREHRNDKQARREDEAALLTRLEPLFQKTPKIGNCIDLNSTTPGYMVVCKMTPSPWNRPAILFFSAMKNAGKCSGSFCGYKFYPMFDLRDGAIEKPATGALFHHFNFDAMRDSPNEEVLDYQYGNSGTEGTLLTENMRKKGGPHYSTSVSASMPRSDFLYVKWRDKRTKDVHERSVDLRTRLPADITNHRIYFIVQGPQLHVYLISPEKLNPNPCPPLFGLQKLRESPNPGDQIFGKFCNQRITRIYSG